MQMTRKQPKANQLKSRNMTKTNGQMQQGQIGKALEIC